MVENVDIGNKYWNKEKVPIDSDKRTKYPFRFGSIRYYCTIARQWQAWIVELQFYGGQG